VGLQIVFLDDPVRPYPPHQRVLGDCRSACLDQCHRYIECAAADLNRLSVSNHFAAMRKHPEPPEPMLAGRPAITTMSARAFSEISDFCGKPASVAPLLQLLRSLQVFPALP
jgi:hypothetical protein